ncbi:MAG TPA: class I SAM-dependent methyltransferase [Actinomycetota bacterium]
MAYSTRYTAYVQGTLPGIAVLSSQAMRAAEIFERWYVASILEPALGRGRARRRMAELAEIRDRLLAEATIAPTADVLDVSCAYGLLTYPAGEEAGHAIGVDQEPAVVTAGRQVPAVGASLGIAAPTHLPFPDARFDVVLWRGALGRSPSSAGSILAEATRVLRPEGRLAFAEPVPMEARPEDPALRDLWSLLRDPSTGIFHRDGLSDAVEHAGFDRVRVQIERRRAAIEDERAVHEIFDGILPASIPLAGIWSHAGVADAIIRAFVDTLVARVPATLEVPEAYVTAEKPR